MRGTYDLSNKEDNLVNERRAEDTYLGGREVSHRLRRLL